ncbi:MAG: hypothetical protein RSF82_06990 [Angelakisella sp.]
MGNSKTFLITTAVITICGLIGTNLWGAYNTYQQNIAAAARPNVTQEQMDKAAAELAKLEAERLEELLNSLPPIQPRPEVTPTETTPADAGTPGTGTSTAEQNKPDEYVPSGEGETIVERPEFSKSEPPPPPSVPDDQKNDPSKKPDVPKQPENTTPKNGQMREDTDGDGLPECYMKGFGWMPYSPGGTYESAPNAGTGEVIGH